MPTVGTLLTKVTLWPSWMGCGYRKIRTVPEWLCDISREFLGQFHGEDLIGKIGGMASELLPSQRPTPQALLVYLVLAVLRDQHIFMLEKDNREDRSTPHVGPENAVLSRLGQHISESMWHLWPWSEDTWTAVIRPQTKLRTKLLGAFVMKDHRHTSCVSS